jgi:hypothetical protein
MSLPYIYSRPQSEDDWASWAFNHAVNHYDWILGVQRTKGITGLQQFLLSPIDPENMGLWLYNHQIAHDQVNAALGMQGFNLLELDWRDTDQFALWLRLNGDEHQRVSTLLGVG